MKTITLARKPISQSVAKNVLEYGCGGLNIDASRIRTSDTLSIGSNNRESASVNFGMKNDLEAQGQHEGGRFPANLILQHLDGEPGCPVKALDDQSGILKSGAMDSIAKGGQHTTYGKMYERRVVNPASEGGASRFFKQVKP